MSDNFKTPLQFIEELEIRSLDDGARLDLGSLAEFEGDSALDRMMRRMATVAEQLGRPIAYHMIFGTGGESIFCVFPDDSALITNHGVKTGQVAQNVAYRLRDYCLYRLQLRGRLEEDVDEEHLTRRGCDSSLICAGQGISYGFSTSTDEPVDSVVVLFRPELLAGFIPVGELEALELYRGGAPCATPQFFRLGVSPGVMELGEKLIALSLAPPGGRMLGRGLMLQLIAEAVAQLQHVSEAQPDTVRLRPRDVERLSDIRQHMDASLGASHTIDELSRWGGLNRRKLTEGFKLLFGCTIGNYLLRSRMLEARRRLQEGEAVSHVAEAVGYQSRTSFSRAYTRVFGIGPSETQRKGR